MDNQIWYVYLLECEEGKVYAGVSPNPNQRLSTHQKGKGALFTQLNHPKKLLAFKAYPTKTAALKMEKEIKKMPKQGKLILAKIWNQEEHQN